MSEPQHRVPVSSDKAHTLRVRGSYAAATAAFIALILWTVSAIAGTADAGTIPHAAAAAAPTSVTTDDSLYVVRADQLACSTWLVNHPRPHNALWTGMQLRCDEDAAMIACLVRAGVCPTLPTPPPTTAPPTTPPTSASPTVGPTTPAPTTAPPTTPPATTAPPTTPPATTPPVTTSPPTPTPTGPPANVPCLPHPAAPGSALMVSDCPGVADGTNTGVPPGETLTPVLGNVLLNTPDQVYEDKDIMGCVSITAPNVTFRRSRVTCNSGIYSIDVKDGGSAFLNDLDVSCGGRGNNVTGIGEALFTATRVNVHDCENGFDVDNEVIIQNTYCHDLEGNDNDCVQGTMTHDVTIKNSTLIGDNQDNSAIEGAGLPGWVKDGWVVTDNMLSGGGFTLYCPRPNTTASNVKVIGNRFGTFVFGYADSCDGAGFVWSNNRRDSTGEILPVT